MESIATWPLKQRAELFQETGARKNMLPAVIEKDFWVCWVLGRLFASAVISQKILFKGGTSLSKVFKLIERFSEDIDLVLDWNEVAQENPTDDRTKTKQDQFNKQIVADSQVYIKEQLLPEMEQLLGDVCEG